jgi:hypothetical protein
MSTSCQHRVNMVPKWFHHGVNMVSTWCQHGVIMASTWRQSGVNMADHCKWAWSSLWSSPTPHPHWVQHGGLHYVNMAIWWCQHGATDASVGVWRGVDVCSCVSLCVLCVVCIYVHVIGGGGWWMCACTCIGAGVYVCAGACVSRHCASVASTFQRGGTLTQHSAKHGVSMRQHGVNTMSLLRHMVSTRCRR